MAELKGWPEANLYLWHAGIHTWAESYEKAEEYYREALRLRPGNELATYDVANFLITHNINVEEGLQMLLSLMVMNPDSAPYLYTYGVALYKMGNYQEAENALQKAWDRKPYYDHKHFVLAKKINDELNRG
jgi:tetratricopeptide (TPR) repeat protein